jgi:hypothetical protein
MNQHALPGAWSLIAEVASIIIFFSNTQEKVASIITRLDAERAKGLQHEHQCYRKET